MNDQLPDPPIPPRPAPEGSFDIVVGRARALRRRRLAVLGAGTAVVVAMFAALLLSTGEPAEEIAVADERTTTTEAEAEAGTSTTATSGPVAEPTTTGTTAPPTTTTTTEAPPETTTTVPPSPEQVACQAPDGPNQPAATTSEEFVSRWLGTWVGCGTGSVFCRDEAGFEVAADGQWWLLDRAADGSLLRRSGAGQFGTWEVPSTSDPSVLPYQFDMHYAEIDRYIIAHPTWEVDVPRVHIDNNGVCIGTYVRAGG